MATMRITRVKKINNLIQNFPIEEILAMATAVMSLIPGGKTLVAILSLLAKLAPSISKASTNIQDNIVKSHEDQLQSFNRMFEMALTDGVITDEEKRFLSSRAIDAGIPLDEFELMCTTMCNPYSKQ